MGKSLACCPLVSATVVGPCPVDNLSESEDNNLQMLLEFQELN